MPTDLKSFDLPSESEMRFSVNRNPHSIIEYALSQPINSTDHTGGTPLTPYWYECCHEAHKIIVD